MLIPCRWPVRTRPWHHRPLLAAALLGLWALRVNAQAELPSPALLSSPALSGQIAESDRGALPVFISGEQISGRPDLETVIEGSAELRRGDTVIKADRLEYYQPDDQARARGKVRINRAGNVYEGPALELKLDTFEGFFSQPSFEFLQNDLHGQAERIDFLDAKRAVIRNVSLTSCRRLPGPAWMPDWILRATAVRMDTEEDVGTAEGAVLSFMRVPLLPVPYLSFPLSDRRKSGFLPPTPGLDNVNGLEIGVPYYWNIAPNRDATLTPTLMSKRGVNLGSEFRYLEAGYTGQLRLDWMPDDKLRDSSRWGLAYSHDGTLATPGGSAVALSLKLNRVSDDNYWRDFTRASTSLTQRLLPNDLSMSWSSGEFSHAVRALRWQTLQDASAPIIPPYDRLPQLATSHASSHALGFDYALNLDYTRFQSTRALTGQPNAQRVFSLLQLSRPWILPSGFITPKLQLHASSYSFDAPLANAATSASRVVPTLSLDAGLVFERDTALLGRNFLQTLEPRAFYVNTPYRDQNLLPNYDSGGNDFNFASIYTENAFVGNDRISDSNLLTLGVTTRLLDPASGAETLRLGLAQRLRFKNQEVTLPGGSAVSDRISDILVGGSISWDPKWTFDAVMQFNPKDERSVRSTVGARYLAGPYRVLSAAYRYQRELSEQVDVSWQWPINDLWGDRGQDLGAGRGQGVGRWYSVGRLNYSLNEGKLVDALVGLEYDEGCWLGRVVLERLQTSSSSANARIMVQLEFVGFTRLGVNPLKSLKENIPAYQYLREPGSSLPSRFNNYD
jgi:LPS-assembly protein